MTFHSPRAILIPIVLLCLLAAVARAAPTTAPGEFPQVELKSESLKAIVYLPDAERGFYRGPRFDWSSMIGRVECGGHAYFAPFRIPHDPTFVDAGAGPADEIGMDQAPGFDDARPGGTFLKIGVGTLRKRAEDDKKPYFFNAPYPVVNPGVWKVSKGSQWVEMEQTLEDDRGWGCIYTRKVSVDSREPKLEIQRTLKNTGRRAIDTTFYSHNFIVIDDTPIGPAYEMKLPFPIQPREPKPFDGIATLDGKSLTFRAPLGPRSSLWAELADVPNEVSANQAKIHNRQTGGEITITGDAAPLKFNFYAERTAICPEAFIAIRLEPGQSRTWRTTYTFTAHPAAK